MEVGRANQCLRGFLWLAAWLFWSISPAQGRTWTDTQGRAVQGEFVRIHGTDVVLQLPGNKIISVPLASLVEADRQHIRGLLQAEGFRVWTNTQGRQVFGQWQRVRDGQVYVKVDGNTASIPFETLSRADRQWVRKAAEADGIADQLPEPDVKQGQTPPTRTWTDIHGKSVVAALESVLSDGRVMLSTADGTRVIARAELSPTDQDFLANQPSDGPRRVLPGGPSAGLAQANRGDEGRGDPLGEPGAAPLAATPSERRTIPRPAFPQDNQAGAEDGPRAGSSGNRPGEVDNGEEVAAIIPPLPTGSTSSKVVPPSPTGTPPDLNAPVPRSPSGNASRRSSNLGNRRQVASLGPKNSRNSRSAANTRREQSRSENVGVGRNRESDLDGRLSTQSLVLYVVAFLSGPVGIIWIATVAFKQGDTTWGFLSIFCGICTVIYGIKNMDECAVPLFIILVGIVARVVLVFTGGAIV